MSAMENAMSENETVAGVLERRRARRRFLVAAGQTGAVVGGLAVLAACGGGDGDSGGGSTPTPTPTTTPTPTAVTDTLNFALNLEYLEAQFYSFAAFGTGLAATSLTGTGAQGTVTGGRKVAFTDPVVAQFAREIAYDEAAHVDFLRSALGGLAIAQPAINIDGGAGGAFTAAATAAGLPLTNGGFDPYASDENFLLAAYLFEDVGVTAYKGAAPALAASSAVYLVGAGILAAEAYHAGLIRSTLYRKGLATPTLRSGADAISDARDRLDGTGDIDQGISGTGFGPTAVANVVPADPNGIAYSRTAGQVLNIVYLNNAATNRGGFFPVGVNGSVNTSVAN